MSSSDPVLGYPATKPASIDLGPVPGGAGAKPSAKSTAADPAGKKKPIRNPQVRSGPPLPKRPKGRLFVGSVFLIVLAAVGVTLFNAVLRYTAYGEVVGRRIELAVPWPGVIQSIHVREGDHVRFGDLIVRIDNLELRQKIEEIDDSLRLQRAQLASELAMLKWEAEKIRDLRKLSQSEFYDKWSELLWEQSRLADLNVQLKRLEPIHREGAASSEQLESLRFQFAGQQKRVEQLTEAVRALKQRSDESPIELDLEDRVRPTLARIENLQAELQRTRKLIQQGDVRAPAGGRIVRTHRFAGEYADPTMPVVELLVEGSTELVLYLPQAKAEDYPVGTMVTVNVNPANANVACQVHRVAMEMQKAPAALARYYQSDETLQPIYLHVIDGDTSAGSLKLGSQLRLPRAENLSTFIRWKRWWHGADEIEARRLSKSFSSSESVPSTTAASQQDREAENADKPSIRSDGPAPAGMHQDTSATTCQLSPPVFRSTLEHESVSQR